MEITKPGDSATGRAIARAVVYLGARRDSNGWWTDFHTLAGPSDEWVSAFVGLALAQAGDAAALAVARETWSRLRRCRWWSPGWGFNRAVPSDADTTLWVLHLAAALRAPVPRRTLRFLASHVNASGGVATYARSGPIGAYTRLARTSFSGWCGTHTCVTAAGAGLPLMPHRQRVLEWLRGAQQPNGSWKAYWWCSPHYATALASEALAAVAGPGDADRVSRASQWTADDLEQLGEAATPFEKAFALRTLLLDPAMGSVADCILKQITMAQRADGSWVPSARLRIPPPHVTDPDTYHAWVEGGQGGGSIQTDENACFTAAAVLQALNVAHRDL